MIPDKIHWFMGYNNLGLILEQERKHWLLKTDKKKQIEDKKTGDVYRGQIDNIGSDIILESEKLPIKHDLIQKISYSIPVVDDILGIEYATFTHSAMVNGFMFARILSTSYPINTSLKNYKLKLENCTICIIPFGGSINSDNVFAGRWVKTTTAPKLLLLDDNGNYTIEKIISFNDTITNPVFYYPLLETMQPLDLVDNGNGVYTTEAVNDNGFIGYPLYWFTCDQSNIGPKLSITNNTNSRNEQLIFVSNAGNASKYNAKLFINLDGNINATPDGTASVNYKIICKPKILNSFKNISNDFNINLDNATISFYNKTTLQNYPLDITYENNNVITMSNVVGWRYVDDNTYEIDMNVFDTNCLQVSTTPLISVFDVHFDETISFEDMTNDTGYAGIRMGSSSASDIYNQYPHDLNKWDGLPTWMNEATTTPQHMAIYSIHNTPGYMPEIPESRQTAALLFSPGKLKTSDENTELTNDERGRIYMLSNDETTYENNSKSLMPKPARTLARICDIPTSVMQLSNITGLSPTSIVDKKYVRSESSYSIDDKNRLYNVLGNRWVKPIDLDITGKPITDLESEDNEFVFNSETSLKLVDLMNHNDYRNRTNINPMVDPQQVTVNSITNRGTGYKVDDLGVVVVGGFAFNYTVTEIDTNGEAKKIVLTPSSSNYINLSNFNMLNDDSSITEVYGTSPLTGTGVGLKFSMMIDTYENIKQTRGEVFDGLYAFVKLTDGLWLYSYIIDLTSTSSPKAGAWFRKLCVSEYEQSTSYSNKGGLSSPEAFINSIIPSIKSIAVNVVEPNKDPVYLSALSTSTFMNIFDKTKTPIANTDDTTLTEIDMCKFYCDGINKLKAKTKTYADVVAALETAGELSFDTYVFWNWVSNSDTSNLYFNYGIIRRSLNNFVSNDYTTTLPINSLNYDKFVHVNSNTTVVWDVDDVGTMMWIYNPTYQKHETYNINPETRELYVEKNNITWADIDVRDSATGNTIKLVDSVTGKMLYNIMTNNPVQASPLDPHMNTASPMYQQPHFVQLTDLTPGVLNTSIVPEHQPMGNWQLVFPRIQSFKFANVNDGRSYTPIQLQTIKARNINNSSVVVDEYDKNVNAKTLIIDESTAGITVRAYNTETGLWEIF